MNNRFLNDKLILSELPGTCAPRHRLLMKFHQLKTKRLMFISAPAGFGKTVTTHLWLEQSGRVPIWINLDYYDNAPSVFYRLLCNGLMATQPDNKKMLAILNDPGFSSTPAEHAIRLLSEFKVDNRQYALVFDDTHSLTSPEILKTLPFMIRRLPVCFVTIILSRNDLTSYYSDPVTAGKCCSIGSSDLAFSAEEIGEYFAAMNINCTPEEVAEIAQLSGGWPIGISLLAKSGELYSIQKDSQILEHYIKKQIWDRLDSELKDFVMKTAIVEEISEELCTILTGVTDVEGMFSRISTATSFTSRSQEKLYHYHHLFLEFARKQLAESDLPMKELHKKAAQYFIRTQQFFLARYHALQCEDTRFVVEAVMSYTRNTSPSLDEYYNFALIFNQFSLSDDACDRYPFLYVSHIWLNFLSGNAEKMTYYLDRLYERLPDIVSQFPQFVEHSLLFSHLDYRISLPQMVANYSSFLNLPRTDYMPHSSWLTMHMPFLHRSNRDYSELLEPNIYNEIRDTFQLFNHEHFTVNRPCLLSGLAMEQNHPQEALKYAQEAICLLNENSGSDYWFAAHMHLAAVYEMLEEPQKLNQTLNQVEHFIRHEAPYLRPNFLAYKTNLRLRNGDTAAATEWLEHYFVIDQPNLELYKIYQHFTTARAYILLADYEHALRYIRRIKKLGSDFCRTLDILEIEVLKAIVEWQTNKQNKAIKTLGQVVQIGQSYSFVHVISNKGAAVLPILKRLLPLAGQAEFPDLDARFLKKIYLAASAKAKHYPGITTHANTTSIHLSKQQLKMIRLLAKGYTNSEIIEQTGLSINTIKSHTRIAYEKLGVNQAVDAINKARELGFIDD